MYWPVATPAVLAAPDPAAPPAQSFVLSRSAELLLTLAPGQLDLYNAKPAVLLARVRRTADGLSRDGSYRKAWFSWDGRHVFVLTDKQHLLTYALEPSPAPYEYIPPSAKHVDTFPPGPGEGAYLAGWNMTFAGETLVPGLHGLVARPDGLTLLLLFPHPALLHLPLPPFPADLPDPSKLAIADEALSFDAGLSSTRAAAAAADEDDGGGDLSWSRALGAYALVLPGGPCFVLCPPAAVNDPKGGGSHAGSTVSLPRGTLSDRSGSSEADAGRWAVQEVELWEEVRGGVGKRRKERKGAVKAALNGRLNLLAVGSSSGAVHLFSLPSLLPHTAVPLILPTAAQNHRLTSGPVVDLSWTPDGSALAVAWARGWGCWSSGGRLLGFGAREEGETDGEAADEDWLDGVRSVGWLGGGLELVLLSNRQRRTFIQPFAKSSVTTLPTPSATLYPLLITASSLLLSPVAALPSSTYLSTLHSLPSSFVTIPLPSSYIPYQYPPRYATVSDDGRLVAVAGRRGFATWSRGSGRWKVFENEEDEERFRVRGGMCWFLHVLVVGVEEEGKHYVRMYSRDDTLSATSHLSSIPVPAPIQLVCLHDNSLLVYTTANTFYHFLIVPTDREVELRLCGSISFEGVVQVPGRVRAMSWLIPLAQKKLGNPADDLPLATVIFLIDTSLVLLRPRKAASHHAHHRRTQSLRPASPASPSDHKRAPSARPTEPEEVKYDFQVLADRVESYWTHLTGIGTLENSLWAFDGERLRVWLDALTVDRVESGGEQGAEKGYKRVGESVSMPLDFYPLSVLMDKGIVAGIESELSTRRTLSFGTFKVLTSTHLFLPHLLRFHLARGQIKAAVQFATHFRHLSYFAHALEMLLHGVLEQEADEGPQPSPQVDAGLEWKKPLSDLSPMSPSFTSVETLAEDAERTADVEQEGGGEMAVSERWKGAGVLPLVVEVLDHFPQALEVVVGCARKTEVSRWDFLFDVVGNPRDLFEICLLKGQLKTATSYLLVLHTLERLSSPATDTLRVMRQAIEAGEWDLCKDLLRFLHSVDEDGSELVAVVRELGLFGAADLQAMIKGTTADDSPFVPEAPAPSGDPSAVDAQDAAAVRASPSAAPSSPGSRTSSTAAPLATPPRRPPLPTEAPSSSSLTGLSSLLFGSSLASPSASPAGGQGRVFSRPVGPVSSAAPSPSVENSRRSPRPAGSGGRWV